MVHKFVFRHNVKNNFRSVTLHLFSLTREFSIIFDKEFCLFFFFCFFRLKDVSIIEQMTNGLISKWWCMQEV